MNVLSPLLYYLVIRPVSWLPWKALYVLSDFLFFILFRIIGYRKKIVIENLRNSFPDKSKHEIQKICYRFYAHLCDLIVESLKMFTVSEQSVRKRMRCLNPEIPEKYFAAGSDIIVTGGHYNNWEMCGVAVPFMFKHHILGIFKPLKDPFFNKLMQQSRSRFGTKMIPMQEVKDYFGAGFHQPTAVFFIIDQSPSNPARGMWTSFLNQETCFMTGAGRFAVQYNIPVLFGRIEKVKRGYYTLSLEEIKTGGLTAEEIMLELIRRLDEQIVAAPEFWLWSHRRWKHKRQTA